MKSTLLNKLLPYAFLLLAFAVADNRAQTAVPTQPTPVKRVNFGYSQNPKTKNKIEAAEIKNQTSAALTENGNGAPGAAIVSPDSIGRVETAKIYGEPNGSGAAATAVAAVENNSAASKTLEVAKRAAAVSPTEIYKIGVGDVLFVSVQNAPSKVSTYFTVLNDGTIDYPLAGEMVSVAGLTSEEAEDLLKRKVKLYENPQISVRVRENASHSITVLGLVEKAGEKFLQREAVPLYVIKAEAVIDPRAGQVVIKRAGKPHEIVDLRDAKTDDFLIFPGDVLEFKSPENSALFTSTSQFYYIGGEIVSAGQKDFHAGISLTQAILASGGLRKNGVKRVVIRRKNEQGLLSPIEFDLSAIKNGKQPDPILQAGDTIEIVKY